MANDFFKKFEDKAAKGYEKVVYPEERVSNKMIKNNPQEDIPVYEDNFDDDFNNQYDNRDDYLNLYPAQKPESFHFFILENQYQDLERLIRGVKDVWDKDKQKWVIKRKEFHCFTDEESEEIIRTAQSHFSSDVKLAIISKEEYPVLMQSIYQQLWILFKEIMDYRFGRFGDITKQMKMKQQAVNIFNVLMMRIKVNYSRAVEGRENRSTHDSVKGQESLQQTERKNEDRGYS